MAKRMKYIIKSCPSDDTQVLQNLLNEMSINGWELYSMSEVENDDKLMFNCIFMTEDDELSPKEEADVINWGTVKNPIEKMLSPELSPYEKGLELIEKLKTQKKKISHIKSALDEEDPASEGRKTYNDKISSSLKEYEDIKKDLVKLSNPNNLYERLGVDVLSLSVSEELIPVIDTDSDSSENISPELIKLRYKIVDDYGYVIPSIRIMDCESLMSYEFAIQVRGIEVFKSNAYPKYKMFYLDELNINKKIQEGIYDVDVISGRDIVWIKDEETRDFWIKGISSVEYIAKALDFVIIRYIDELFDYSTLMKYCEIVEDDNPFLVENIIPDMISFADLRYILTSLISERVSIKDITLVFSKLNDFAQDATREDLLSKVRLSLSRIICADYADEDNIISALELSDKTFEKILPAMDEEDAIVKIDADFAEKLAQKVAGKVVENDLKTPILIAPIDYRQILFSLLVHYINDIVVLAREEVGSNCKLEIVDEV